MLNRSQIHTLLMLRNRSFKDPQDKTYSMFSHLPVDLIRALSEFGRDDTEINKALHHAASSQNEDLAIIVNMLKKNPRLLLQTGNVVTRGGVDVRYTTLYEFFLGEGDPDAAKQIEPYFAKIPNGENEQRRQYERYKLYIEALAKQIKENKPAYDLRPLFEIIKNSFAADITEALTINDPNRTVTRNTSLRKELAKFRRAVEPKRKTVGMHYEHYTTLIQALDLLYDEWEKLSNNGANYDKCRLVWRQIIGFLQRGLPAVDRFAFARAFDDKKERTPNFKYDSGSFPDVLRGSFDLTGVGFDEAIYGVAEEWFAAAWIWGAVGFGCLEFHKHMSNKNFRLAELMQPHPRQKPSGCVIV